MKCKKSFRDINGSRQSLRSTKSSTTLLHDAEVDPTELEEVAVELDAAPDEDEPGDTVYRNLYLMFCRRTRLTFSVTIQSVSPIRQSKFDDVESVLSSGQFLLLPQLP
jgi:hypothetical protein